MTKLIKKLYKYIVFRTFLGLFETEEGALSLKRCTGMSLFSRYKLEKFFL